MENEEIKKLKQSNSNIIKKGTAINVNINYFID